MHCFVSFVSVGLFYVEGVFKSNIISEFLSVSSFRTSASSCAPVCGCQCEGVLETRGPVLLLCSWDVFQGFE